MPARARRNYSLEILAHVSALSHGERAAAAAKVQDVNASGDTCNDSLPLSFSVGSGTYDPQLSPLYLNEDWGGERDVRISEYAG